MKSQWMLISALFFALIIAVFAVINVDAVEVNFLFATTSTPLILVIIFSTLFGGLAVGSLGLFRVFVLQRKVKHLEKQVADHDSEVQFEQFSEANMESEINEEKQPE